MVYTTCMSQFLYKIGFFFYYTTWTDWWTFGLILINQLGVFRNYCLIHAITIESRFAFIVILSIFLQCRKNSCAMISNIWLGVLNFYISHSVQLTKIYLLICKYILISLLFIGKICLIRSTLLPTNILILINILINFLYLWQFLVFINAEWFRVLF